MLITKLSHYSLIYHSSTFHQTNTNFIMKPVIFATALATLLTPVVSRCSMDNRWCYWIGTAPFCESTKFKIGEIDETGKVLKAWTKDKDRADLCSKFNHECDRPSTSCCNDYGSSCWRGYKRLWCEVDE